MDAALKDNNGNMILPKTLKISDNQDNPKATNPKRQSYEKMIIEAISTLKERNGTSIPAIKKYISSVFLIPEEISRRYVAKFLKKSTEKGILLKVDKKYRYKLSANTIKEAQKKITKPKKIKKISKNENEKENIEPVAGKSSTLSNTEKTKIQKPKSVKKKNSKIEGEPKKPKPKKTKEGQSSSPKETKIKKTKVSTEAKIKKMEIPKEVKTKKTKSTEENKDDPLKKKAKIEMNKVNNDLQIKLEIN
ncbi:histone H1-like isoform X2 [Condylostylus longicornis]|uniref:histone H1-like isoform X2 n=1 Tax=Condylostylus longicornis TaxID=2530218 RepID=UPI00244DC988|nr:histone H1-like isoform X2 [Condylostylus longicornis]